MFNCEGEEIFAMILKLQRQRLERAMELRLGLISCGLGGPILFSIKELQASLGSVDGTANRLTTGKTGLGEFDWISTNPVLNQQQHTYNKWSKQRRR
ncbi:hypothetical protein T4D_871 [Trichinella pseudospiralis]|uniref:Uncharacterized protein n=1 Tax=Trichinella pseudospiralis TaxID=6337 RepID=A0A0V1G0Z5_TRIPS|nr:hypothetical protein T4D_871 [Trichinella pseudospiralis]